MELSEKSIKPKRRKYSYSSELLGMLYNPSSCRKVYFHQLRDGKVYVYDRLGFIVTFEYLGSDHGLMRLEFFEGHFAGKKVDRLPFNERNVELHDRVKELFPMAHMCMDGRFRRGYQWFLLESALHDRTTQIRILDRWKSSMRFQLINEAKGLDIRFIYRKTPPHRITEWIVFDKSTRYSLDNIDCPPDMVWIFDQLFALGESTADDSES